MRDLNGDMQKTGRLGYEVEMSNLGKVQPEETTSQSPIDRLSNGEAISIACNLQLYSRSLQSQYIRAVNQSTPALQKAAIQSEVERRKTRSPAEPCSLAASHYCRADNLTG
jgi:hypothetical protein